MEFLKLLVGIGLGLVIASIGCRVSLIIRQLVCGKKVPPLV